MAKPHEELHQLIDLLDEETAENIAKIIKKLVKAYDDTLLTPEEIKRMEEGEAQIARGEYVTLDDYVKRRGL